MLATAIVLASNYLFALPVGISLMFLTSLGIYGNFTLVYLMLLLSCFDVMIGQAQTRYDDDCFQLFVFRVLDCSLY